MTDITIPREVLEAGHAEWWMCIKRGARTERSLEAAFLAMIKAWPEMCFRHRPNDPRGDEPSIILPLPKEPSNG